MSASDPACVARGIPDHLHQLERAPDSEFLGDERLFVRFSLTSPSIQTAIKFERQSCNRSKYCDGGPDDVLFDGEYGGRHQGYGVIAIDVASVLQIQKVFAEKIRSEISERRFTLQAKHKPVSCNYAHAEIISHENGREIGDIGSKAVKKELRDILAELYRIDLPMEQLGNRLPRY